VERLPHGRHHQHSLRSAGSRRGGAGRRPLATWTRLTIATGTLALAGVLIPAGTAGAASAAPASGSPSLKATLAEVSKISNEIGALGQQYDQLKIQLTQARREASIARETYKRDEKLLASGQNAIGQIAAEGYMNGDINPTLQMLQSTNPQQYLNQASIMLQLQQENGDKISVVTSAQAAAKRAAMAAVQEESQATKLSSAMRKKVATMQAKENELNSSAFKQALAIYDKTGTYPSPTVTGSTIPEQALRHALTRIGDPYVWAAAGPTSFDCSGLVVWAYAQIGISLPHFTGDLWMEGVHVSRDELQPGDLLFFFPGEEHVGFYVGNGMMLDAPQTGQNVQIQPVLWPDYDGAVRIA
jgi:peptidoglycan DL-endopeptidase CwlO